MTFLRLVPASSLLVVGLSCGGNPRRDLKVMSYAPQGAVDKAEPVEIRFDKPVVDAAMVGSPADASTVKIAPAIAWKGYWHDRQTLVIESTEALAPSTRYQITLAGDLGTRTEGFAFSFVHKPLAVEGVWGVDADALAPDGDVPMSFNQPVAPKDVAAHCRLVGAKGPVALLATKPEAATNVSLHPAHRLEAAGAYTLACEDLAGVGGNAALDKPYALAVRVRAPLAITKLLPAGNDVAADEVTLSIAFSTPVTLEAARKAVTSTPPIPGIDQGYLSGDGTEYKVTADLETETDYQIHVAGLADTFGQTLAAPFDGTFHTGDARARLSMERGIFALEGLSAVVAQRQQVRHRVRGGPQGQARPGPDDRHELRRVGRQHRRQAARLEGARRHREDRLAHDDRQEQVAARRARARRDVRERTGHARRVPRRGAQR
jgi:hypothetical protein